MLAPSCAVMSSLNVSHPNVSATQMRTLLKTGPVRVLVGSLRVVQVSSTTRRGQVSRNAMPMSAAKVRNQIRPNVCAAERRVTLSFVLVVTVIEQRK